MAEILVENKDIHYYAWIDGESLFILDKNERIKYGRDRAAFYTRLYKDVVCWDVCTRTEFKEITKKINSYYDRKRGNKSKAMPMAGAMFFDENDARN